MGYDEDGCRTNPWSSADSAAFSLIPTVAVMHCLSRAFHSRSCAAQTGTSTACQGIVVGRGPLVHLGWGFPR